MHNEITGKKAQIGETMTWIVATIIIVVILIISITISNFSFGKNRNLKAEQDSDILASKSMFAYLLASDSGKTVYSQIKGEGNLNSFNGNLAVKIFNPFAEEYAGLWLGVADQRDAFPAVSNDYFLARRSIGENPYSRNNPDIILEEISLDENRTVALVLPEERK
ncbi:MAG: hypothetical protein UT01_C0062G0004 [Candidatus Daviesbacteria bacterium GW2011_GWA1_38_7]|nr:MAG: hypothetical protein UT01_C0062G0004 [Candidatus Daviesbacteria bacterium GW2011_GWA1_38_7]